MQVMDFLSNEQFVPERLDRDVENFCSLAQPCASFLAVATPKLGWFDEHGSKAPVADRHSFEWLPCDAELVHCGQDYFFRGMHCTIFP